jgi:ubiquinone/menaquinone biosynthesis C-methylase UbiE
MLQAHFGLADGSSLLDVGCAKGFMLHDLALLIPGITVKGVDVSAYAIEHAIESMRPHVSVADARELPFPDGSFDVVVSINTVHNLERADLVQALREIERVKRRGAFITVDAYRTDEERRRMEGWKDLFAEAGYTGDYFWFIP